MNCPFLKESAVEYCEASAVRRPIPLVRPNRNEAKCSSPEYATCSFFREHGCGPQEPGPACPHLRESVMQYCGAAPVAKPVPYSESAISRCGSDAHRYCELYLETAHPRMEAVTVAGLAMPKRLWYAPNHMWLDVTEEGVCHVGVDAFLARALGSIDAVTFIWTKGMHRPAVVLTVAGTDVHLTFPNELELTGCNLYARAGAARIVDDPYGLGWLFEGNATPAVTKGLREGADARAWMANEERRMSDFVSQAAGPIELAAACGGTFVKGAARLLGRRLALMLSYEFFSPYAGPRGDF